MSQAQTLILGGGITGLAAGLVSGLPVYEAVEAPGGICSSYYVRPGDTEQLHTAPDDGEVYRFEIGGGHWIFGGDPTILRFINSLTPVKTYFRRSSVFFPEQETYVPYPLQNHLSYLDKKTALAALTEMMTPHSSVPGTMAEWIKQSFGPTLTDLFFGPFHRLYTADMWQEIAPQDAYKSPVDPKLALQGAFDQAPAVGYNVSFVYPEAGLNTLAQKMAARCDMHYGQKVVSIDPRRKQVIFADGSDRGYDTLLSTLPLNKMMDMTGLEVDHRPDPHTSVLVLNIGGVRGPQCPDDHWLYIPDCKSGFHRVGFYSNVDVSFMPKSSQEQNNRVSIYIERAYPGGQKPLQEEIATYSESVVKELQAWGFIEAAEVVDPTWIDVAYTWSWPGSGWKSAAMKRLEEEGIFPVGRYARWNFQGIADSIKDGFYAGAALKG